MDAVMGVPAPPPPRRKRGSIGGGSVAEAAHEATGSGSSTMA